MGGIVAKGNVLFLTPGESLRKISEHRMSVTKVSSGTKAWQWVPAGLERGEWSWGDQRWLYQENFFFSTVLPVHWGPGSSRVHPVEGQLVGFGRLWNKPTPHSVLSLRV